MSEYVGICRVAMSGGVSGGSGAGAGRFFLSRSLARSMYSVCTYIHDSCFCSYILYIRYMFLLHYLSIYLSIYLPIGRQAGRQAKQSRSRLLVVVVVVAGCGCGCGCGGAVRNATQRNSTQLNRAM